MADAQRAVAERMPSGYHVEWSGQFEYMQRAKAKLADVVPVTPLVIFVLLYLNFGRLSDATWALAGGA